MNNTSAAQAVMDAFDDLEELARESMAPRITFRDVKTLDDLDDLLQESLEYASDKDAGETLRRQLKKGGISRQEAQELEFKIQEWELRREWKLLANVAVFHESTCATCGGVHQHFVGMYYEQEHRTSAIKRLVLARTAPTSDMSPVKEEVGKRILLQPKVTEICSECATEAGFDWADAQTGEWHG